MEKKRSAYVEEEIESDENPIAKEKDYARRKRDTNLEEKKRLHSIIIQSPKKRIIIHKDRKTVTQMWGRKRSAYVEA